MYGDLIIIYLPKAILYLLMARGVSGLELGDVVASARQGVVRCLVDTQGPKYILYRHHTVGSSGKH